MTNFCDPYDFFENMSVSEPIFHTESKNDNHLFRSRLWFFLHTLLLFSMKILALGKTSFLPYNIISSQKRRNEIYVLSFFLIYLTLVLWLNHILKVTFLIYVIKCCFLLTTLLIYVYIGNNNIICIIVTTVNSFLNWCYLPIWLLVFVYLSVNTLLSKVLINFEQLLA